MILTPKSDFYQFISLEVSPSGPDWNDTTVPEKKRDMVQERVTIRPVNKMHRWQSTSWQLSCFRKPSNFSTHTKFSMLICRAYTFQEYILFTGRIVTFSHPVTLFFSHHRTYQPLAGTVGFCLVPHGTGWSGKWNPVDMMGLGLSHDFNNVSHLKKVKFLTSPACQPLQLVLFWAF